MDVNSLEKRILGLSLRGIDVTEAYQPEVIAEVRHKFKILPQGSMELREGWDMSLGGPRRQAVERIMRDRPRLIVGGTSLQKASTPTSSTNEAGRGIQHATFCLQLCKLQEHRGGYFVYQQPASIPP